jgi:acyl-CoA synthetase
LLANARALSHDWKLFEGSTIYSLSPLSHNLGFGAMVMTLIRGGRFVIHDLPRGSSLADRIVETEADFLFGVPTHAIDLLAELRARGLKRLGRVRGFRISGASAPPSVAEGLLAHGVTPQSGYGMTEAGSHHYTLPDDTVQRICETSGRACKGYDARIFAEDDPERELAAGETGQIGGRGASLMLGYFDDLAATEAAFNKQGWFMTGDIGWMDAQGYIRVTGRKKDLIIRGGHNIYPARIEALASRHEAIDKVVALPAPDERLGEKVCLAVTLRSGQTLDAEAMLEHLDAAGLSKFDMPEYFIALDAMPLTPSGKILKRELVAAVAEGRLKPTPVRFKGKAEP